MSAITVTDQEYFEYDAVNASRLKRLLKSPAHYLNYQSPEPTEAMRIGTAFHAYMLGTELQNFGPRLNWRTKEGKEQQEKVQGIDKYAAYCFDHELSWFQAMGDSITRHPGASRLLTAKDTINETGIIWQHNSGTMCKVKPDSFFLNKGVAVVSDIKTTEDASEYGFIKACSNFDYAVSDALYRMGVEALTGCKASPMHFIMVEKTYPHYVGVYTIEQWQIDIVTQWVNTQLAAIANREIQPGNPYTNPDHKQGFYQAELPDWYINKF